MDLREIIPWIVVVIAALAMIAYSRSKKRREAIRKFARQRGLSFSGGIHISTQEELGDFQLFYGNGQKSVSNVVQGEVEGTRMKMFDYRIRTEAGHSSRVNRQSVLIVSSGRLDLPAFVLYPKNIFMQFLGALGEKDIDFPSHYSFSHLYSLRGKDESTLRKVFTDRVLSYFENHKGLTVEGKGESLLCYYEGRLLRPDELQSYLLKGSEIISLLEEG